MSEQPQATVPEMLDRLRALLRDRALLFSRVGGEVALVIVGHDPQDHVIRATKSGTVEVIAETARAPIVTIGIKPSALRWLLEGTLDVERAFEQRRLAIEGDLAAAGRFAQCFTPSASVIGVRKPQR